MGWIAQNKGIAYSLALHICAVLFALFGVPQLVTPPEPDPVVVSIEVVAVAAKSNIPKKQKPIMRKAPKVKPKPKPKPKPQIIEKEVPPPPKEKPTPKPKPKEKPAEKKESLDDIMKRLQEESAKREKEEQDAKENEPEKNTSRSDQEYDDSLPLALSEKDAIRSQFARCWSMPAGAKNAHELAVRVFVEMNPDGSVKNAKLVDEQQHRYNSDNFFRAAADSAIRAVRKCSPLENMPADKYGSWREIEINFDPKELFF